ncbi:MAG TPA: LPS assembly protein LptD, partial [Alphaproteobacteria bacterium]|nr:LPS assembly protein LptD [Alphaproteobacteria bacterium]
MPFAQKSNRAFYTPPRWMMTATAVGLCLMMGAHNARAEDDVPAKHDKPKVLSVPLAVMMAPGAVTNQKPSPVMTPAAITGVLPETIADPSVPEASLSAEATVVEETAPAAATSEQAAAADSEYYAAPRPSLQIIYDEDAHEDLVAAAAPRPPLIYSKDMPIRIDAEHLSYDDVAKVVTATGNVEVVQGDKILRADQIVYNQNTDTVAATGNVTMLDDKGDVSYADYAEMTGNMKNGYIKGLLALLKDGSRFTAAEARHEDGNQTTMTDASYTPCEVCEENPEPIWQIKADKVVHDKEEKSIKYKNARLELLGVPMAFTPVFVHADPTVKRKSGFLRPRFGWTDEVGTYVEGGYYFGDIAPNIDATLHLRPTTRAGVLAQGQWRQRFETGRIELNLSGVQSDRLEESGIIDKDRWRGHAFANGLYDIDDKWRAGFNIEKASDKGYLRLYDISKENVLESEVYAERFSGRNYSRISGLSFQDVRLGARPEQPDIFPRMEHRMIGEPGAMFGGRWSAGVSALSLFRDENQQDVQRGSVDIGWERLDILPVGLTTQWNLGARGDFYALQDRTVAVANPGLDPDSRQGRGMAIASVTTSYPMVKRVPQG